MQHVPFFSSSLAVLCVSAALLAQPASADDRSGAARELSPAATLERLQTGSIVVLDVRTPAEFAAGHLPGAINLSVEDEYFRTVAETLERDKSYVVHCTANPGNGRSARAQRVLRELGIENVTGLQGGFVAWQSQGLPLASYAGAP